MSRSRAGRASGLAFDAIVVEGALIAPAMLARIAQHQADLQKDADYNIPKGLTLRDEVARYFRIAQAMFRELTVTETPSTTATVNFVENLLREVSVSRLFTVWARALLKIDNSRSHLRVSVGAFPWWWSRLLTILIA